MAYVVDLLHSFGRSAVGRLRRSAVAVVLAVAGTGLVATAALSQSSVSLMADSVTLDRAGRLIATGSVEVWQGAVRLTARRVQYDQRRGTLAIEGPIAIHDGSNVVILADQAQLSSDMRAGLIESARVVIDQQMQVAAARIERDSTGSEMHSVVASSCSVCAENPRPLWEIRADNLRHDDASNQLLFTRAQFRFAGVPVFYAPRLRLPGPGTRRARGVLLPTMSADSDLGVSLFVPYFVPIGESHDLTLTPGVSTQGMTSLGLRWRSAFRSGGFEVGGQIARDRILPGEIRGYGYVRALFGDIHDWQLSVDVLASSDRRFLETYGITDEARLHGNATVQRVRRDQWVRVRALGFHSLRAADVNDELPNLAMEGTWDQRYGLESGLGGELRLNLGARAHYRRSSVDGVRGRDVAQTHLQLGWRRSGVLAGGIVGTAAVQGRVDHLRVGDDLAFAAPITRRAVQAMVEFRWPWAAENGAGVRSVIEPVVQVVTARRDAVAMPNDDHLMPELDEGNLFALNRYSGNGAPDDGSRITAGFQWSRYDAAGWSLDTALGRVWRRDALTWFDPTHPQPLGESRSDWLVAGRVTHPDGHAFGLRILFDDQRAVSRAETNVAWRWSRSDLSTRFLYLPASTFEQRTTTLSEWSVDFNHRFDNGWASSVGWEYDIGQQLFAAARTGLTFRNECLSFELAMSRHFVTATNPTASTRYNLQIELLGIGSGTPTGTARRCSS
ncbi:MAG: LPS assembly protein LptD [Paracoccaceae bacterium]